MAGIVIVGCPFLVGFVAGPCIDLPLLGTGSADVGQVAIARAGATAVAFLSGVVACATPTPSAVDGFAGPGVVFVAVTALLIGYIVSLGLTALVWFLWQAAD